MCICLANISLAQVRIRKGEDATQRLSTAKSRKAQPDGLAHRSSTPAVAAPTPAAQTIEAKQDEAARVVQEKFKEHMKSTNRPEHLMHTTFRRASLTPASRSMSRS